MPLPVPIDRDVHTTRTALPDCAQSRESATVRNFRQRRVPAATVAALPKRQTQLYRSATGALWVGPWGQRRGMTLARARGHLISYHFQFRRLEIPPRAHSKTHARQHISPQALPLSATGGDDDNNNNLYKFQTILSRGVVGTGVFRVKFCVPCELFNDTCPE